MSDPALVVAPIRVNGGQVQFSWCGWPGPLADDEVDLKIFHGGVQGFFDGRGQPVDFVDEQDVVGLQVCQDRGEVAGVVQDEPGGRADAARPISLAMMCAMVVLPKPGGP